MSNHKEATGVNMPEWPYPVHYGNENELSADVLVLGGGLAGCHAAINAAEYVKTADDPVIDRKQVEEQKSGVYAPVNRSSDIGWKELYAGISRIMISIASFKPRFCSRIRSEAQKAVAKRAVRAFL